ncbi:MAG: alpha-amylase family glycosyl hydrolase, partial [Bacillota bacterium]|nr:alpha-amylase family glycosyl hydrolase [Bacillota bacterium]
MTACHNSHNLAFRSPFGAVRAGETVSLTLEAAVTDGITGCDLILRRDGEKEERIPMEGNLEDKLRFFVKIKTPSEGALLWYYFILTDGGGNTIYYGNNAEGYGGSGRLSESEPIPYQITVYEESPAPEWFKNAVVYQIFPDRFCRGSDFEKRRQDSVRPESWHGAKRLFTESFSDIPFYIKNEKGEVTRWPIFGGTLEGICEKLLYLKSLGISAVYLNPIFEASSSHKYDTADYTRIDPGFGNDESFKKLVTEAEKLGISLILDGVFS